MDRISDVLRETLDHKGSAPPPLPDLTTAVEERRRNQRRRARTVFLSAAAVVIIGAGSTTAALTLAGGPGRPTSHAPSTTSTSTTTDSPSAPVHEQGIPFAPLPAARSTLTTELPMTGSSTPTCTAATLRLHLAGQRVVDSGTEIQLAAESVGSHTCRLDRNTLGLGITATRGDALLDVGEASDQVGYPINVEPRIGPGATVILNGLWDNWCGPHLTAAYPVLRPTSAITITSTDKITPPPCNQKEFGTDSAASVYIDALGAPGSILSLAPAIHVPATVRAGRTLHYQVTLTNPTDRTVPLDPCPNYTQSLVRQTSRGDHPITTTYRLNCAAIHAVPAHTTVTLQMQQPVPTTGANQTFTLGWTWGDAKQATNGSPWDSLHHTTFRATG